MVADAVQYALVLTVGGPALAQAVAVQAHAEAALAADPVDVEDGGLTHVTHLPDAPHRPLPRNFLCTENNMSSIHTSVVQSHMIMMSSIHTSAVQSHMIMMSSIHTSAVQSHMIMMSSSHIGRAVIHNNDVIASHTLSSYT